MYPCAYTWMRNPMNVMMRHSRPDSASIRNATSILRSPVCIQVQVTSVRAPAPGRRVKNASKASIAEDRMAAAATMRTPSRLSLRPKSMRNAAPMNGMSGMRRRGKVMVVAAPSALHESGFVEVHGLTAAEEPDEDREAHGRLGGRERDDEEREDVPLLVAERAREGQHGEVAAVELKLDAHEHDERVSAHEDARRSDEEQNERQHEVVIRGHARQWCEPPESW